MTILKLPRSKSETQKGIQYLVIAMHLLARSFYPVSPFSSALGALYVTPDLFRRAELVHPFANVATKFSGKQLFFLTTLPR